MNRWGTQPRLLESRDLFVNQALLTGEPYPVEKLATAQACEALNASIRMSG